MLTLSFPPDLRSVQKCLTEFVGFGGLKMKTVHVSFGVVPTESVLDGSATAVEVTATSDGRMANTREWHDGDSADSVYVERYSALGREFHGWIDSTSRKLVQVG